MIKLLSSVTKFSPSIILYQSFNAHNVVNVVNKRREGFNLNSFNRRGTTSLSSFELPRNSCSSVEWLIHSMSFNWSVLTESLSYVVDWLLLWNKRSCFIVQFQNSRNYSFGPTRLSWSCCERYAINLNLDNLLSKSWRNFDLCRYVWQLQDSYKAQINLFNIKRKKQHSVFMQLMGMKKEETRCRWKQN